MARPERNNVDYFPFDCHEGKKMYYIEETYGNDGFAVFVKLLRELAKTEYHYLDLSKNVTMMFLAAKCKVSTDLLKAIINDLVELDKFDRTLWDENNIIWCQDFIDSIQDAYKKRSNECITYDSLLSILSSLGVRKQGKSNSKGGINTQSRVKDTKVKESKENIPTLQEFTDYAKEHVKNIDTKALTLKYKSWKENNWKDGNNKQIKNWKAKLLNTLPYISTVHVEGEQQLSGLIIQNKNEK